MILKPLAVLSLALLAAGCGAGWRQPLDLRPGPLSLRQQVQVWTGGHMERWQGVVVTRDSLSGVPFVRSPDYASCRHTVARGAVDSIRLGHPVAGLWKTIRLVLSVPLAIYVLACAEHGCPSEF